MLNERRIPLPMQKKRKKKRHYVDDFEGFASESDLQNIRNRIVKLAEEL